MNEQLSEERLSGPAETPGDDHADGNETSEQIDTTPNVTGDAPAANTNATNAQGGNQPVRRELILIADIELDGDVQSRVDIDETAIKEFAEAMNAGAEFPPVVVFHDGATYWCADGFHRVRAAKQSGKDRIEAEIHEGEKEDAILHSVGANVAHGIRRTNEDKRRAVTILLQHEVWRGWTVREIARRAGVTHPTVSAVKKRLEELALGGKVYHPKPAKKGVSTG